MTLDINSQVNFSSSGPEEFHEAEAEAIENKKGGNTFLKILSFNFDIKTAAVAGNRFVGWEVNIGGRTQQECLTPALVEKTLDGSNLYGVCGIGQIRDSIVSSRTVILPVPTLLIPKGGRWTTIAPFKQAGDTFPLFRLEVEWITFQ